jgi:hypothetical protein
MPTRGKQLIQEIPTLLPQARGAPKSRQCCVFWGGPVHTRPRGPHGPLGPHGPHDHARVAPVAPAAVSWVG